MNASNGTKNRYNKTNQAILAQLKSDYLIRVHLKQHWLDHFVAAQIGVGIPQALPGVRRKITCQLCWFFRLRNARDRRRLSRLPRATNRTITFTHLTNWLLAASTFMDISFLRRADPQASMSIWELFLVIKCAAWWRWILEIPGGS